MNSAYLTIYLSFASNIESSSVLAQTKQMFAQIPCSRSFILDLDGMQFDCL